MNTRFKKHNCEVAIHSVVFKPIIGHNLQIST